MTKLAVARARFAQRRERRLAETRAYFQQQRERRLAEGLCLWCGDPATRSRYCETHRMMYARERRGALKRARRDGVCTACRCRPAAADRMRCSRCLAVSAACSKRRRLERLAAGLCRDCGLVDSRPYTRCKDCLDASNAYKRRRVAGTTNAAHAAAGR